MSRAAIVAIILFQSVSATGEPRLSDIIRGVRIGMTQHELFDQRAGLVELEPFTLLGTPSWKELLRGSDYVGSATYLFRDSKLETLILSGPPSPNGRFEYSFHFARVLNDVRAALGAPSQEELGLKATSSSRPQEKIVLRWHLGEGSKAMLVFPTLSEVETQLQEGTKLAAIRLTWMFVIGNDMSPVSKTVFRDFAPPPSGNRSALAQAIRSYERIDISQTPSFWRQGSE